MREAVPADGAWLLGHAEGDRLRQRTEDPLGGQLAGGPQQRQVELPAHDRGGRQHADRVGRQRRQPPPDHRPHTAGDQHPTPAGPLHGSLGGQQAHDLPDKQRVTLGPLIDGGGLRLGGRHPREHLDQASHLVAAQPTKAEQLALADQLPHRLADPRLAIGPRVAVGPHHQQPGAAESPRQELQQQQGGLIGGMQIIQDQHQRLHRRRPPEEAGDRLEQVEARRLGLLRGNQGNRSPPKAFGKAGDQLGDLDRSGPQPGRQDLLVTVFDQGAEQLCPRPERRCAPCLPAATPQHPDPPLGRESCQVLGQPGLADPGLPGDQEQPPPATDRVLQAGNQLRRFPVPAHKDPRSPAAGRIPHVNHRAGEPSARPPQPEAPDPPAQRFTLVERLGVQAPRPPGRSPSGDPR